MKAVGLVVVFTALGLCACNKPESAGFDSAQAHGRFAGIGIYSIDRMWSQIAGADASKSPAASRLKDDRQVIVVVDTRTGEVRQCGNMSGFCVGMNPWAKSLSAAQSAPLAVLKHEQDLEADDEAALQQAKAMASKPAKR